MIEFLFLWEQFWFSKIFEGFFPHCCLSFTLGFVYISLFFSTLLRCKQKTVRPIWLFYFQIPTVFSSFWISSPSFCIETDPISLMVLINYLNRRHWPLKGSNCILTVFHGSAGICFWNIISSFILIRCALMFIHNKLELPNLVGSTVMPITFVVVKIVCSDAWTCEQFKMISAENKTVVVVKILWQALV